MILKRAIRPTEVKLSEVPALADGENPVVQVLRVGKFNHPKYGEFEITRTTLSEMLANFKNRVRGIDIALDFFHNSDEDAAGWIKELKLSEDGNELWAKVDWTPKARTMLSDRSVRYFSPDFAFTWKDAETKKEYKNVLFGGGLTNRPFVKDMAAIVADEKGETDMTEVEKLAKMVETQSAEIKKLAEDANAAKAKLAEHEKKMDDLEKEEDVEKEPEDGADDVPGLKKKLAEMAKAHKELSDKHEKLMAEMEESKKAKQLAEKAAAFNLLLSEGKACAAQKDAFIKGDMGEFIKLAQPVNLEGRGSVDSNGDEVGDDKVLKLAEEKVKANKGMELGEAISQVRRELNPKKTA